MIPKCGEPGDDRTVDAKRRHLIGDALFGLWNTTKNHESKVLKRRPLGFGDALKIRINLDRAHERDSTSTLDVSYADDSDSLDPLTSPLGLADKLIGSNACGVVAVRTFHAAKIVTALLHRQR